MSKNNTKDIKAEKWSDKLFLQFEVIRQNSSLSNIEIINELIKILSVKVFFDSNNKYLERDFNKLFEVIKSDKPYFFQSHEIINLKSNFLENVLEEINFFNEKLDYNITGKGFDLFIEKVFKNSLGQFYTPLPLIKYMVEIINPKAGETIYDPCCGTGGFFMQSKKHIKKKSNSHYRINDIERDFYGNDESNLMVRVAKLNMKLHGFSNISIERKDSLEEPNLTENKFDIVFVNPPFGKIKKRYEQFEVYEQTKNIELLYLEKCLNVLKPGGRMGIILPSSNLSALSSESVRNYVESKAKIINITNLPKAIFYKIGFSGISSAVLFFKKFTKEEEVAYQQSKQKSNSKMELRKLFDYQLFVVNLDNDKGEFDTNFEEDFGNIVEQFRDFEQETQPWKIAELAEFKETLRTQIVKVAESKEIYE